MIRTHIIPCALPRTAADTLNRTSGSIYTCTLVTHYRVYRKRGNKTRHWLSQFAGMRLNDYLTHADPPLLHAHSKDAAQEAFYKASKVAKANRHLGAHYPHKRKYWRTTIWKGTGIRRINDTLSLARARGLPPITIPLPDHLRSVLWVLEVRLVYDRWSRHYTWHLVVENGIQPKQKPGTNVVSVDLGEIHPAVVGDAQEATIITCRERRHQQQGHAKRLACLSKALSRKHKGSRRYWRLKKARTRMRAKHKQVMRDLEHKISRAVVEVATQRQAATIVIGDVRDIADGVQQGKVRNQQSSQWNHGQIRKYVSYKAEAEGMSVVLIEEHYTSQTCPQCGKRHKPHGRTYTCGRCGFSTHRDVVGQINILSRYTTGQVGSLRAPTTIKHRMPHNLRLMRRRRDTGQPVMVVACGTGCQPQEAVGL